MSLCQIEEINKGGAYPKSCPTCGLGGRCVKGLEHPFARSKPVDMPPARQSIDLFDVMVGDRVRLGGEFEVTGTGARHGFIVISVDGEPRQVTRRMLLEHLAADRPIEVGCDVLFDGDHEREDGQSFYVEYRVLAIDGPNAWIRSNTKSFVTELKRLRRVEVLL